MDQLDRLTFKYRLVTVNRKKKRFFVNNSASKAQKCYLLQGHIGHILLELS